MASRDARDVARQVASVLGAIFQVAAGSFGFLFGLDVGAVSGQNRTLVVPAGDAFAIWGVIFLLCLGYAAYQALPSRRADPVLRRVGWWSAGAFVCNGIWEIIFPSGGVVAAQALIVGSLAGAVVAFLRLAGAVREHGANRAERWLVAPALGLLAGWLTAATFVSVATTLVATGALGEGTTQAVLGAALLIAAGLFAAAVIGRSKAGLGPGTLAYAAAIVWALAAVVVNQYDDSTTTTVAALVAAIPVVVALFGSATALPAVSGGTERQGTVGRLAVRDGRRAAAADAPLSRGSRLTDR